MSNNPPKQDDPDSFDDQDDNRSKCPYCNLRVDKQCRNPMSCSNRMTDFIMNQMMLN